MTDMNKAHRGLDYKDIQIEYTLRGLPAIQDFYENGEVSVSTLERAAEVLMTDSAIDASELALWVSGIKDVPSKGRPGRAPIQPGETRNYKVQFAKDAAFLRLPTPMCEKGMTVPVTLSEDGSTMTVHVGDATESE